MSIQIMMSRSLCSLVAVSCLALAGCEKEEKDSAGEGTGSASEGGASEGGASEGGSDPTEGGTSAASASEGGDTQGQSCEGDWTLGSVPFSGDPTLGQACDGEVPKNCADGTFIKFGGTGECVCIAECSSLGKAVGELSLIHI